MGALLGVIGLVKLGVRNVDVELRGDSVTALSWAKSSVPRGQRSMNAATIFTILCVALSVDVKSMIISNMTDYPASRNPGIRWLQ